jgi:hypothetical protein
MEVVDAMPCRQCKYAFQKLKKASADIIYSYKNEICKDYVQFTTTKYSSKINGNEYELAINTLGNGL